jgi:hypothetical protein
MKRLLVGAVLAGVAVAGLRAAARHGREMCAEHCGGSNTSDQACDCQPTDVLG